MLFKLTEGNFICRKEDGIDVIFITDISKNDANPEEAFWSFQDLASLIKEGRLKLLRFNLLDLQVSWDC